MARAGTTYPFEIEVGGRFAGQLTVNNLVRASAQFASLGYWIDRRYETSPWGVLIGVVLGLVGGLYNLVKQSLQAVREARIEDQDAAAKAAPPKEPGADGD